MRPGTVCASRSSRFAFYLALILCVVALRAHAGSAFEGRVVGVADGDTITVLVWSHEQIKVRLAEIDAPEKSQPFGQRSKQALSDLVFGKTVRVEQQDVDRYGRVVGRVFVNGMDVTCVALSSRSERIAGAPPALRVADKETVLDES